MKTENDEELFKKHRWLIRPASVYEEEYRDCTSIKARLHQYFIFGKTLDCSQWNRDSQNAYKWEEYEDKKAAIELINSEKSRRRDRLIGHVKNNVWERRTAPPDNWNAPLPEHIEKSYEDSYLSLKAMELRGERPRTTDVTLTGFCSIM